MKVSSFFKRLTRRKYFPIEGAEEHSNLKRSLTVFDLVFYGIGSMCGGNIYGISIVLLSTTSGAGSFISCILAGFVAALNGQSYAELSNRIPFGGGGYSFTYMICGEFLAFITGWAMLLEYLLGFAFSCIGAASAINIAANDTINEAFRQYIGSFPPTNGYLTDTPNILAGIIAILVIILLGLGAKISVGVNSAIAMFSTLILIICAIYMASNSQIYQIVTNPIYPNETINNSFKSPFMPFGISGIIRGSAITFNSFSGFDALSLAGDIVKEPKNSIPLAINIAILIVFIITTFYYICLSFYQPWYGVNSQMGLSGIFFSRNIIYMQIMASLGEITGYLTSAFCNMFALSHIVFALSKDGLLFSFFNYISPSLQVPIYTNLIFGLFAALLSVIFDMNIIANFMSAGVLINYTLVTINLLILRLVNVEKLELQVPNDKGGVNLNFKSVDFIDVINETFVCCRNITKSTFLFISLSSFIISTFLAGLLIIGISIDFNIKLIIGVIFGLILIYSVTSMFFYKYYRPDKSFLVLCVPSLPLLCILCNVVLASQLNPKVWYRIIFWIFIGLLIYFGYGMRHSRVKHEDDETNLLIQNEELDMLALDP